MSDKVQGESIKEQRDRFLAFSFTASDILLEVNKDGNIKFSAGASEALTGEDDKSLIGKNWLSLFDPDDRPTLVVMKNKAVSGIRSGPLFISLNKLFGKNRKAIIQGMRLPESEIFYVTLNFNNILMAKVGELNKQTQANELLDRETFLEAANQMLDYAKSLGKDADITLLEIDDFKIFKEKVGPGNWEKLKEEIARILKAKSIDGQTAASVTDGRFSVIHDTAINADLIKDQIGQMLADRTPDKKGAQLKSKTITTDVQNLDNTDTTKALFYTLHEFERKGTDMTIETLNSAFKSFLSANAYKISEFKSMVNNLHFNFNFQPILNLKSLKLLHYEMLVRFQDGRSPMEWIMFGEDIGMASDLDMAVCDRATKYILNKSADTNKTFAINLSGQSVQKKEFTEKLLKLLDDNKKITNRMVFEITESHQIKDLGIVNEFIKELQNMGMHVCLDDFGAGSASFQYLQKLHVNYVKIDGQYVRKMSVSEREQSMIKHLIQMCHDLDIKVVAEMIETRDDLKKLQDMGADFGQGYLFSAPLSKPSFSDEKFRKAFAGVIYQSKTVTA